MSKKTPYYDITIIEKDGTIFTCVETTREKALQQTNAAEKVRHCQAWRITYKNMKG